MRILKVCSSDNIQSFAHVPENQDFTLKMVSEGRILDIFQYTLKKDKPLPYSVELLGKLAS